MTKKFLKWPLIITFCATLAWAVIAHINQQTPAMSNTPVEDENLTQYFVDKIAAIEEHTQFSFNRDGWSFYGIITIIFAILGVAVAYATYSAQESVERHTKNVSVSAQIGSLKDLLRHIYRNLVCTSSILLKYRAEEAEGKERATSYPSEANMLKLQTQPDIYILPIDIIDDNIFKSMTEMKKLMHNYNCEIDIASKHFATKSMLYESLGQDFNSLLFKPMFLAANSLNLRAKIEDSERQGNILNLFVKKKSAEGYDFFPEFFFTMINEHIEKLPKSKPDNIEQIKSLVAIPDDEFFKIICGTELRKSHLYRGFTRLVDLLPNEEYQTADGVFTRSEKDAPILINRPALLEHYRKIFVSLKKENAKKLWNAKIINFKSIVGNDEAFSDYFKLWDSLDDSTSQDNETCDAFTLLCTILKVDIALEYCNIGMIKF